MNPIRDECASDAGRSRPNNSRVMRTNFGDTTAEIFREHSDSLVATQTDFFINNLSKYHDLVNDLEVYSNTLNNRSSLGKNKSESLMKIINECKKVDNNLCSREQITNIRTIIEQEKGILSQHRHHALFNCFFSLFKVTTLNKRVTSLKIACKLDNYLQQIIDPTHSQKLQSR